MPTLNESLTIDRDGLEIELQASLLSVNKTEGSKTTKLELRFFLFLTGRVSRIVLQLLSPSSISCQTLIFPTMATTTGNKPWNPV